jgi:hypothetical protein
MQQPNTHTHSDALCNPMSDAWDNVPILLQYTQRQICSTIEAMVLRRARPATLILVLYKCVESIHKRNRDILLGTWNVRSLHRAGSLMAAARELAKYKLDLVDVQVR